MTPHHKMHVPHLTTALKGPLGPVEQGFLDNQLVIEAWFREAFAKTQVPLQSSVDIRNAGFKLAPVDTNLFPAGINNLNPDFLPLCIQAAQMTLSQLYPGCKRLLIIAESHTRNPFYYENLATLEEIYSKAGYEVRLGSLLDTLTKPKNLSLTSGRKIVIAPVIRLGDKIGVEDYVPCLTVLNNDLSGGVPDILQNISQPITPSLGLGWASRLKSNHFRYYDSVCSEFAALIDMDPWLINPIFRNCGKVDFMNYEGEDCVVRYASQVLKAVQLKYDAYGIDQEPFVVIKADAGTYGMGVMMTKDPESIRHLNRKQRVQMSATKGGQPVNNVIIQEGVYTFEMWDDEAVAEPVVYLFGHHVVGGFYRVHTKRGVDENLNSPGMHFEPLAFETTCINPEKRLPPEEKPNRFYAYGVIARLALLAAGREIDALGEKI